MPHFWPQDADAFAVLTQSKFVVDQGAAAAIFVDEYVAPFQYTVQGLICYNG
jgi:hypothetical protein